jgi:hypothetical protein
MTSLTDLLLDALNNQKKTVLQSTVSKFPDELKSLIASILSDEVISTKIRKLLNEYKEVKQFIDKLFNMITNADKIIKQEISMYSSEIESSLYKGEEYTFKNTLPTCSYPLELNGWISVFNDTMTKHRYHFAGDVPDYMTKLVEYMTIPYIIKSGRRCLLDFKLVETQLTDSNLIAIKLTFTNLSNCIQYHLDIKTDITEISIINTVIKTCKDIKEMSVKDFGKTPTDFGIVRPGVTFVKCTSSTVREYIIDSPYSKNIIATIASGSYWYKIREDGDKLVFDITYEII